MYTFIMVPEKRIWLQKLNICQEENTQSQNIAERCHKIDIWRDITNIKLYHIIHKVWKQKYVKPETNLVRKM